MSRIRVKKPGRKLKEKKKMVWWEVTLFAVAIGGGLFALFYIAIRVLAQTG